ncbi:MAG: FIST N-terminal domain-containing protein [Verrucomicrobiota bacterium]
MSHPASVSIIVKGYYQRSIVETTAGGLRHELGQNPSFAIFFATPDYMAFLPEIIEAIKTHGGVPLVVGCSTSGLMGKGTEIEGAPGFSLQFFNIPDSKITPVLLQPGTLKTHQDAEHLAPDRIKLWVTLINPFYFVIEDWLETWNSLYPGIPVFGGVAAAHAKLPEAWVFLDDQIIPGAIALAIEGHFGAYLLVSQGCQPLGTPLQITKSDRNLVYTLNDQSAHDLFNAAYQEALQKNPALTPRQILAGVVIPSTENPSERDSFLIRNIFGNDVQNGALSLGYTPSLGQTFQFHQRDPHSASLDLEILLEKAATQLKDKNVFGAFICTCTGRGETFFGSPHHDAKMFMRFFPQISLSGFFSQGEIGPIGKSSFSHEQSTSIVIFYET